MNTSQRSGFTLIELIIYMGLLGILIAIMSQVFLATLSVKLESDSTSAIQQDGKYIMARLGYDIRRAHDIVAPTLGQTSSGLTLQVTESGVEKTYTYSVASAHMMLSNGSSVDQLNGDSSVISQFSVTRIGNSGTKIGAKDTLQIVLVVTSTYILPKGQDQLQFQTNVGLR